MAKTFNLVINPEKKVTVEPNHYTTRVECEVEWNEVFKQVIENVDNTYDIFKEFDDEVLESYLAEKDGPLEDYASYPDAKVDEIIFGLERFKRVNKDDWEVIVTALKYYKNRNIL
jgi:hypothetical protein